MPVPIAQKPFLMPKTEFSDIPQFNRGPFRIQSADSPSDATVHERPARTRIQRPPVATLRHDCAALLVLGGTLACPGHAGPAGLSAAGADRLQRAVQPGNGRIHLGPGGARCRPFLGLDLALHGDPRGGGADLRAVLLRARHARAALAALADGPLPGALFSSARLLPARHGRRHRQPRPAHFRRHQHLHPAVAVFLDDRAGLGAPAGRLFGRAVVDLAGAGFFPDRLCAVQHRRSPARCSASG